MPRIALALATCLILCPATHADRAPITPELRAAIHKASVAYFEKFRSYECTYSESTESESNPFTQMSDQRIVEDALGQIRLESSIHQVDESGTIAATLDTVRVYDLRTETRAHSQPGSLQADQRLVTISPTISVTSLIRPKSYVTVAGQPMHELLDSLQQRDISVYTEEIELKNAPDRLVELTFAETIDSGDVLRHTYTLDRAHSYLPLRQVVFFNKKRFRVLEPTFQEVSPGIHFPVKAVKISYYTESDDNEMRSITKMSVQSIRINTDIPADTFKLELRPGDTITDLRGESLSPPEDSDPTPLG